MMKRTVMAIMAFTLAAVTVNATVVNFTTGEGYSDGDLTLNSDWYDIGIPAPGIGNAVSDAAGIGIVTLTNQAWHTTTFDEALPMATAGDVATARIKFRYTSTGTPLYSGILSLNLGDGDTNDGADLVRVGLRRTATSQLQLFIGPNGGVSLTSAFENTVGITNGVVTSDWLELTLTLTKLSSDYRIEAALTNLTTGLEVNSYGIDPYTPDAAFDPSGGVYGQISTGWNPAASATTDREIDAFTVASGAIVPPPPMYPIIGIGVNNGDFEDFDPADIVDITQGAITFANTPHWHAAGFDETLNLTFTNNMNWSPQSGSRGAMPFNLRLNVNDAGYTVTEAGTVFDVSYAYGRVGGNFNGDETNRVFLFTTDVPVDANISGNDMDPVPGAEHLFAVPNTPTVYQYIIDEEGFYTTTAADIGKTFYLGIQGLDAGGATFPRIDVVRWETSVAPPGVLVDVIKGSLGNGDFQANDPAGVNQLPYSDTPNWHLAGQDETFNFTMTNGSPTRAAMTWKDRQNVNDTGWTVQTEGEVFSLNYTFYRFGNPYTNDETNRTWLFTTRNGDPVDDILSGTNMAIVAGSENWYVVNTNLSTHYTQPVSHPAFYTTTAADIGKTFYLATQFRNPDGLGVNQPAPRIDNVSLAVNVPDNDLSGWESFVADYGLTTNKTDHADADGLNNWGEYVFGGDPTNSNDVGTQPTLNTVLGVYNYSLIGDSSVVAYVVTTEVLTSSTSWTTNKIETVTVDDEVLSPYSATVGTIPDEQFIQLWIK